VHYLSCDSQKVTETLGQAGVKVAQILLWTTKGVNETRVKNDDLLLSVSIPNECSVPVSIPGQVGLPTKIAAREVAMM